MKLYAICLVKNEDDIIGQTLMFATRYCERIFVIDNGSTDATWAIVNKLAETNKTIVPFLQTSEPYRDGLRAVVYNKFHGQLADEDWWLILDADEFLAEDPRPLMVDAMRNGADIIRAWQIQFYYTEIDHERYLKGLDDATLPIFQRRRYYQINWQEPRLFRNRRVGYWDEVRNQNVPNGLTVIHRRRVLNRHYQYRSPEQIRQRLELRYNLASFGAHVRSKDWHSAIQASRRLVHFEEGNPWKFTLSGLAFYLCRRSAQIVRGKMRNARKKSRTLVSSMTLRFLGFKAPGGGLRDEKR